MATREENLKKITDELEQLSDEELEKIAGGAGILFRSSESNSSNRVLIMDSESNSSDRFLPMDSESNSSNRTIYMR